MNTQDSDLNNMDVLMDVIWISEEYGSKYGYGNKCKYAYEYAYTNANINMTTIVDANTNVSMNLLVWASVRHSGL